MSYGWIDNPAGAGAKPASLDMSMMVGHAHFHMPTIATCVYVFAALMLVLWLIGRFTNA